MTCVEGDGLEEEDELAPPVVRVQGLVSSTRPGVVAQVLALHGAEGRHELVVEAALVHDAVHGGEDEVSGKDEDAGQEARRCRHLVVHLGDDGSHIGFVMAEHFEQAGKRQQERREGHGGRAAERTLRGAAGLE